MTRRAYRKRVTRPAGETQPTRWPARSRPVRQCIRPDKPVRGCAPRTLLPSLTARGQGSTQTKKNKILLRIFLELL